MMQTLISPPTPPTILTSLGVSDLLPATEMHTWAALTKVWSIFLTYPLPASPFFYVSTPYGWILCVRDYTSDSESHLTSVYESSTMSFDNALYRNHESGMVTIGENYVHITNRPRQGPTYTPWTSWYGKDRRFPVMAFTTPAAEQTEALFIRLMQATCRATNQRPEGLDSYNGREISVRKPAVFYWNPASIFCRDQAHYLSEKDNTIMVERAKTVCKFGGWFVLQEWKKHMMAVAAKTKEESFANALMT